MKPASAIASASGGGRGQPARQIDHKTHDRRENAERQRQEPEIVCRMADERNVIGELRLGRVEEGRREQTGECEENGPLPDPPERRGAHVVSRELQRRDGDEEREDSHEPDHQGEHDVDHQALVEEPERPERRVLHAGHARQRQEKREYAGDGERADREPSPSDKLAPRTAPVGGAALRRRARDAQRRRMSFAPLRSFVKAQLTFIG